MNKFLKHKYQLIRKLQAKLITAHTPQCVVLDDIIFANNRQMNHVLKLLRSLPAELLISNNPDIAQLLTEAAQHHNLDATAKTNINVQYGAMGSGIVANIDIDIPQVWSPPVVQSPDDNENVLATASVDAYLQKQLEARKEHKRQHIALSHKAKELCVARIKELAKANPKLRKQLRALMCLRREITIIFTESDSQPISEFFNQWIEQVNKGV